MSTINFTEFSLRLKLAREEARLKKAETARRVGVSAAYIGQLESMTESSKKQPSTPFIEKLCQILNINSVWLLTGKGPMHASPGVAEKQEAYTKQPLTEDEIYLLRIYRKLHLAEKDKVIEIAELYSGVKESRRHDGGGKDSQKSNSN